ncbi:MAG: DUF4097 family beta strand repeat protein [Clostridia bacterium]|nr:DUF4097 family beta strand repeat protein [Clostridia bacterium]
MRKIIKKIVVIVSMLVTFCTLLGLTACSANATCVTHTYTLSESFNDILIDTDTADILFLSSENEECKVVCYEREKVKHSVFVENERLKISASDNRNWYDFIGVNFAKQKITVYLPKTEYKSLDIKESTGDVEIANSFKFENVNIAVSTGMVKCFASATENIKITASTGNILLENISANALDIKLSTGDVTVNNSTLSGNIDVNLSTGKVRLTNLTCKNLNSTASTGDIILTNVIATEKFSIDRSTGHVKFDRADAGEIFVTTDTGDVEGSLLSNKIFIVSTDTGRVSLPNSTTGGRCEITTDTGDVKITIINE